MHEKQQIEIDAAHPMGEKLKLETIEGGPLGGLIGVRLSTRDYNIGVCVKPEQLLTAVRTLCEP